MNRYTQLVKHFYTITVAFWIIRPVERLYKATRSAFRSFKVEFIDLWTLEGDASEWYKNAWTIFKEGRSEDKNQSDIEI